MEEGLNNPFTHESLHCILRRGETKVSYFLGHRAVVPADPSSSGILGSGPKIVAEEGFDFSKNVH